MDSKRRTVETGTERCRRAVWLATRTRVDLSYSMHRTCSVVSSNPARTNRMVKCILRYLKGTMDVGILFCGSEELQRMEELQLTTLVAHCNPNALVAYSDASFAPDGAKSHQGGDSVRWHGSNLLEIMQANNSYPEHG